MHINFHHAVINDIAKGIAEANRILKPGGYFIFNLLSTEDESYGLGNEIEENTFVGGREGEEGIPNYYSNENELKLLLNKFSSVEVNKSIYRINMNEKSFLQNVSI